MFQVNKFSCFYLHYNTTLDKDIGKIVAHTNTFISDFNGVLRNTSKSLLL